MSEEKSLFEKLDDVSAEQSVILNEITGVKTQATNTDSRITELEKEVKILKTASVTQETRSSAITRKTSTVGTLQSFFKQSKKSWRWFGTKKEFNRWKILAIISLVVLLVVGLITSVISTICFQIYSTFTFFENAWMVCGVIYLVYVIKSKLTYEVNALASNSPTKYEKDSLGMMFPKKDKLVFRIFKWLAIISTVCNIICIWLGIGKNNQAVATVMEILFLIAIIFAFFINCNLYAQYSIIWIEGHNITTKEKVVLVLPPGAKQFMPEQEFKKKMPVFYE